MNSHLKNIVIIACILFTTYAHTSQPYTTDVLARQNCAATAKLLTQLGEIAETLKNAVPVTELRPIILEYLAYGVSIATFDTSNINPTKKLDPTQMKFDDKGNLLQYPPRNPCETEDFSNFNHPISHVYSTPSLKHAGHWISIDIEQKKSDNTIIASSSWLIPSTMFVRYDCARHPASYKPPHKLTAISSGNMYQATANGTKLEVTMNLQHALAHHKASAAAVAPK